MTGYIVVFALTLLTSFLLTGFLAAQAKRKGLFIAEIRSRDQHQTPTPRVGGIAVVLTFVLVIIGVLIVRPDYLAFSSSTVSGISANVIGLILAVIVLSVVNIADDYCTTPIWLRLGAEILAALVIFWFGIRIPWLSNPFGGRIILGTIEWFFVLIWLVGLSNVMNWLDGVNGLAGGVAAIALAILFFLSRSQAVGQYGNAMLSVIAFGAVLGFLPFNFGNAKAFLGDTGSVFLGFLIGVIAIISGGKVATTFLILAIPFLDAIIVFTSRVIHGQSPFQADRRHLHHRLLEMGLPLWQILGLFYVITLAFGLIALHTQTLGKAQAALAAIVLMLVLIIMYTFFGQRQAAKKNASIKK